MKLVKNAPKSKFWDVKMAANDPKTGEVYIYGDIVSYKWDDTDTTAASFKEDLDALGDIETLNVYVNSYGGSVFQGQAIHTILKRHPAVKNGYVDGLAASIASAVIAACDTVYMPRNAMQMIHNCWSVCIGNSSDMRKTADDLDKINVSIKAAYMSKAGDKITEDKLTELLDAETWLTAQDCYDIGLCDELLEEKEIAASANSEFITHYKNVPESLKNQFKTEPKGVDRLSDEQRQSIIETAKVSSETITQILEVL